MLLKDDDDECQVIRFSIVHPTSTSIFILPRSPSPFSPAVREREFIVDDQFLELIITRALPTSDYPMAEANDSLIP